VATAVTDGSSIFVWGQGGVRRWGLGPTQWGRGMLIVMGSEVE